MEDKTLLKKKLLKNNMLKVIQEPVHLNCIF